MSVTVAEAPVFAPDHRLFLEGQFADEPTLDQRRVFRASELGSEHEVGLRAAELIGRAAVGATVEVSQLPEKEPPMSLLEALRGGERNLVRANVASDMLERSVKAGLVMRVKLTRNANGDIMQHGQTNQEIQLNSLRHGSTNPKMRPRTEAEVRNKFRIDAGDKQGLLKDHYLVVFSPASDDMTEEEMDDEGFFTDTMSMAIQATTEDGTDLETQSAFVAGKKDRQAPRHDGETIIRLGQMLGIDFSGMTAAQIIDTPVYIPKSLMPNGVIDLARLWDIAAGGTFFGQDKPQQDYLEYLEECWRREAQLQPDIEAVTDQLLSEAHTMRVPEDATSRLGELSGARLIKLAVKDKSIDARVFGKEAAYYVEAARHYYDQGNMEQSEQFVGKAVDSDESTSCPGGRRRQEETQSAETEKPSSGGDDADCEFTSEECPECHAKKVRTVVKKISANRKRISGDCGCSITVKSQG